MKIKKCLLALSSSLFFASPLIAQEETEVAPPSDQSIWQTLVMMAIAFAFFYLILWRPEQKRRNALEEQRKALKQGDKVIVMGIIGTVLRIENDTVILKMYDGAKLEVLKMAITEVLPENAHFQKSE